ncbi:prepilin-type N-terminal cleavage/methylation domain-containing protein [Cellulomonas sp.]|uniref:Ig-like domain-containing protein n=1 Tax=Cellulomonas sp. TaxID=40001 RepID=UPI001B20293C|nr:prepilin-type N-terminal cleavage/methylation domain-containing protein [Cellulomonas sp.]MBO9556535.1 prepilin-type N-terminal cleavage/methylation domain-containing protein [Cellulomonas sp.]
MRPDSDTGVRQPDAGFTLIEVVVALFLLGVVAAAALTFFIRGMQSTSHLQRSQNAVAVATEAMERARAVKPGIADIATGTSGLVIGRSKAAVDAAWAAAAPVDVADINAEYDTQAATRPGMALPITYTTKASDTTYTVTTLVGSCFRLKSASTADQACTKAGDATTSVKMYRVSVVVTWKPGKGGQCGAGDCVYRVSALVDPTKDASWNLTSKPVAYDDDVITFETGGAAFVSNILANDEPGYVAPGVNPTSITVNPAFGLAEAVASGSEIGRLKYTPPANESGITSLRYRLRDGAGRTSNEATVAIQVTPKAGNGTAPAVLTGSTTAITVPAAGTGLTVTSATVSGGGSITGTSGTTITYKAGTSATTATIKYRVTDASGLQSATEGTITVVVNAAAKPVVGPVTAVLPAVASTTTRDLDILGLNGLTPTSNYELGPSSPLPTITMLAGGSGSAGTLTLSTDKTKLQWGQSTTSQLKSVGVYQFTYTATKIAGQTSDPAVATVQIVPVATAVAPSTTYKGTVSTAQTIAPPTTNIPVTYSGLTYSIVSPVTCSLGTGAATSRAASLSVNATTGQFSFVAPAWTSGSGSGSCTFTYRTTFTGGGYTLQSATATGTLLVSKS